MRVVSRRQPICMLEQQRAGLTRREFSWESVSERIVKIGLHLTKLRPQIECLVFFPEMQCILAGVSYCVQCRPRM